MINIIFNILILKTSNQRSLAKMNDLKNKFRFEFNIFNLNQIIVLLIMCMTT